MPAFKKLPPHWTLALALTSAQLICLALAFVLMNRLAHIGAEAMSIDDADAARTMIDRALRPMAAIGIGVVSLSALLAFGPTLMLVRRYQDGLKRDNRLLEAEVAARGRELMRTRDAVIFALAKLAEFRSHETGKHLERVQEYVETLARRMGGSRPDIDAEFIETLKRASWLHDIGKVAIPDHLLVKAAPLSSSEKDVIRAHSILGARCLDAIRQRLGDDDFLGMAHEVALSHHERWDGAGYPDGAAGDRIPLSARIVAVADVYDALTSDRIYHAAISHNEACKIIREASGTQFDPQVVAAFLEVQDEMQRVADRLRDGADQSEELEILGEIRGLLQAVASCRSDAPSSLEHVLSRQEAATPGRTPAKVIA